MSYLDICYEPRVESFSKLPWALEKRAASFDDRIFFYVIVDSTGYAQAWLSKNENSREWANRLIGIVNKHHDP
jgi:hypothetical protein